MSDATILGMNISCSVSNFGELNGAQLERNRMRHVGTVKLSKSTLRKQGHAGWWRASPILYTNKIAQ